jgi:hypothetical protein
MRIRLAVAAGAAAVLTAGTGAAAYAVVGHSTVSPTVTGNDLPIDDNHSPTPTSRSPQPRDDRGGEKTPATGTHVEPGDDHGHGSTTTTTPEHSGGSGSGRGGGGRGGGDDDGGGHR